MLLRLPHHQRQDRERFAETARIDLFYLALPSFLACRLLPYGLSVISRSIGEALAYDPLHGASGTLYVIYAQPNAIGIAEIKFREITVQMLFAAMLIHAFHAAFENRREALERVRVNFAATIFASAMINAAMAREVLA